MGCTFKEDVSDIRNSKVADVVLKAGTTPRPRTRYNVGFWAKFGPVGRMLTPDRIVDAYTSWESRRADVP